MTLTNFNVNPQTDFDKLKNQLITAQMMLKSSYRLAQTVFKNQPEFEDCLTDIADSLHHTTEALNRLGQ